MRSEDGFRRPTSCCYEMKTEDGVRRPSSRCYRKKSDDVCPAKRTYCWSGKRIQRQFVNNIESFPLPLLLLFLLIGNTSFPFPSVRINLIPILISNLTIFSQYSFQFGFVLFLISFEIFIHLSVFCI